MMTQPALRPDRVERYNPALARRPQFMDRIPARLGDELLALSAQDHYLEVRTRVGTTLILYALGDAVNQLDEAAIEGLRIHRSHWIARDAVDHISVRGRRHVVVLKDGAELPVGQTYLQLLRRAGFVEHASVTFSPAAA